MLLEKEGLVTIPPRRRPRVIVHDLAEMQEIYRMRCALLEFIAGYVVQNASEEALQLLEDSVDGMGRAFETGDFNRFFWSNVEFHDRNTRISANRTVKRVIDSLLLRTLRLRRISLGREGRLAAALDDHRRLVKAYQDRDANLAAALLRSTHISALQRLESMIAE